MGSPWVVSWATKYVLGYKSLFDPLDLFAHNINFTVICWQWGMRSAREIILEDVFHLIE